MFDLGDVVPLTVQIKDASGNLANAGAVVLSITLPDGSVVTPSVTNPSTGVYQVDYPTTQAGRHIARWVATGANASAFVDAFDVRPADPGYILSLTDAKLHLNKSTGSSPDDEELRGFLEFATEKVEDWTQTVYVRKTFTNERHDGLCYGTSGVELYRGPVVSVASIVSADGVTSWTPGNFTPDGKWLRRQSGPYLYGDVLFTYTAATPVIPARVTLCAKEILRRSWSSQRQPGGGRPSPFGGGEAQAPLPSRVTDALLTEYLGPQPPMVA